MLSSVSNKLAAATLAGALAFGLAGPSAAAPLPTSTATIKAAAPDSIVDVRWRGRHHGGAIFAGVAAGLIGAAAFGAFSPAYGYPAYGYYDGYYPATYAYETYPAYGYYPAYHYYPAYAPYAYYGGHRVHYRHRPHWRHHHVRHHHVRHVRHHRHHW